MTDRPPLPPFDRESALTKVQAAEDAWNTRDPERVAGAYTVDSAWRLSHVVVTAWMGHPHRSVRRGRSDGSPLLRPRAAGTRRYREPPSPFGNIFLDGYITY
jgi:hypothetical protein